MAEISEYLYSYGDEIPWLELDFTFNIFVFDLGNDVLRVGIIEKL